tara:strand:+ start:584 stop:1273 length:690 start_codon:yes stop_codon:yes gene_type:complete
MSEIFVSILVATKNRHNFLENILRNFNRQDYPNELMELIIADDGDCLMENNIPKDISNIKYLKYDKISLGLKRNKLCENAKGDIIIFMDDDDFYPKDKISVYVNEFSNNNDCLLAGSSIMHVYYTKLNKIYKFGPYGKNHCTCGTLAFKKEYFENHKFPDLCKAEERIFLDSYKNKMIQIDSMKSILVIAHSKNTVDKYKFLKYGKLTALTLDDFNLLELDKNFYLDIK